ncbi:MAG: 4-hydroxythreonine-4-phosphate dehydrogenase PdxA [Bacteroidetes bacterium]|nr:4-hydroxythreonine-4-phosphate dehydrogenase PdxA [Bacteroidota bacterium]MCH8522946.1 4-hydroxythreonine-4-phosphate dehydrogenase PdxA [Balneolales bacterium]
MRITIALTPGDYNSIGPEVLIKAVQEKKDVRFVLVSPPDWIEVYSDIARLPNLFQDRFSQDVLLGHWWPENITPPDVHIQLGKVCGEVGKLSMMCVEHAVNMCLNGTADAMVTAPISKEAIFKGGFHFPGHTEFLAEKTNVREYTMMLVDKGLRVGLVTTHIPLGSVVAHLTPDKIINKLTIMNTALKKRFSIEKPKIAVLALNPHAGDGGLLGNEENEIIAPAIAIAQNSGIECDGPFPADGWFGSRNRNSYDAVLAMYHDQGLAPFKALSFGGGVNFTAGLPIIRTSPDHGTAFSLAGSDTADSSSMSEAIQLAIDMASNTLKVNLSKS